MFEKLPLSTENPLEIKLDSTLCAPIDINQLRALRDRNAQRAILQLPLPKITNAAFFIEEEDKTSTAASNQILIDGKKHVISERYLQDVHHFSVSLTRENELSEADFEEKFMNPFIEAYERESRSWYQTVIDDRYQQYPREHHTYTKEIAVKKILDRCLYTAIESPLLHSQQLHAEELCEGMIDLTERTETAVTSYRYRLLNVDFGDPWICSLCIEQSMAFMGLHEASEISLGFLASFGNKNVLSTVTMLGKVEMPSLYMGACYNIMTQKTSDDLDEDEFEEMEYFKDYVAGTEDSCEVVFDERSKIVSTNVTEIEEFQTAIRKLVTSAALIGVNKLLLTTYCDYVLIEINAKFIGDGYSPEESNKAFDGKPAILLKASHYHVRASDPLVRLKIAAFMQVTEESVQDLELFQKALNSHFKAVYAKNIQALTKATLSQQNPEASIFSSFNILKSLYSMFQRACSTDRDLALDDELLNRTAIFELAKTRIASLQAGSWKKSQVLLVNTALFLSSIADFNLYCNPPNGEDTMVVKIQDPLWSLNNGSQTQNFTDAQITDEYQDKINRCCNEIKAYLKLKPLWGKRIPKMFGYGTIDDCTRAFNRQYIRCWGPAIFLENLETQRDFDVREEYIGRRFLRKKIIPAYAELHSHGVLHGNVSFQNIVVTTTDANVKIIDFSNSKIDPTPEEIEAEIEEVHRVFNLDRD